MLSIDPPYMGKSNIGVSIFYCGLAYYLELIGGFPLISRLVFPCIIPKQGDVSISNIPKAMVLNDMFVTPCCIPYYGACFVSFKVN
jgi:hypothetical protein